MRVVGGVGVLGEDIYLTCGVGKMPSTLSWHWPRLARPVGAPERLLSATYLFKEKQVRCVLPWWCPLSRRGCCVRSRSNRGLLVGSQKPLALELCWIVTWARGTWCSIKIDGSEVTWREISNHTKR